MENNEKVKIILLSIGMWNIFKIFNVDYWAIYCIKSAMEFVKTAAGSKSIVAYLKKWN